MASLTPVTLLSYSPEAMPRARSRDESDHGVEERWPAKLVGSRLREARQHHGLTLDDVAREAGLTKSFVSPGTPGLEVCLMVHHGVRQGGVPRRDASGRSEDVTVVLEGTYSGPAMAEPLSGKIASLHVKAHR